MDTEIYIIGGGTSINKILNVPALKDALSIKVTMGCNVSVDKVRCDYLVFFDNGFEVRYKETVDSFKGTIYTLDRKNRGHKDGVTYIKTKDYPICSMRDGVYSGANSGTLALSIAVALGYKKIYMLGMDCRPSPVTGKSHFHDGYNGTHTSNTSYTQFIEWFERLGKHIKEKHSDVEVFNCSNISYIDVKQQYFKRLTANELRSAIIGNI